MLDAPDALPHPGAALALSGQALVRRAVAVLVDPITLLLRSGVDACVAVVAVVRVRHVPPRDRAPDLPLGLVPIAVAVGVAPGGELLPALVGRAVAVVVDGVTELLGPRVGRAARVVAVEAGVGRGDVALRRRRTGAGLEAGVGLVGRAREAVAVRVAVDEDQGAGRGVGAGVGSRVRVRRGSDVQRRRAVRATAAWGLDIDVGRDAARWVLRRAGDDPRGTHQGERRPRRHGWEHPGAPKSCGCVHCPNALLMHWPPT